MWAWSLGAGYRAFSYQFAKTFPVLSKGFEIETKMSIHAIGKNLSVENEAIEYRDRFEGSKSKLNTYSDGFRVLTTIAKLFRTHTQAVFFFQRYCHAFAAHSRHSVCSGLFHLSANRACSEVSYIDRFAAS